MTTYYVSFAHGLDANNGLGPDASHATNKPWKTLGKLLGAAGMASGDTAYVAPGTQREAMTVNMTSPTVETKIIGDVENGQGFKDSGGVLLAGGPVVWSGYLTNDTTAPSANPCVLLNGRDFLTFERLVFIGGTSGGVTGLLDADTGFSSNIVIRECVFQSTAIATPPAITHVGLADTASNWLIERCVFAVGSGGVGIGFTPPSSAIADYSMGFVIRNSLFVGQANWMRVTVSGAAAFKAGGVEVRQCTVIGGTGFNTANALSSITIPCIVEGCLIAYGGTALSANALGQIVENYNYLLATTPRTNVAVGANSIVAPAHALMLELDAWLQQGRLPRPFFMPMAGSPQLGFGTPAGAPAVDLANRPRPAGGASLLYAVGALERHDTAAREVTVVDAGGVGIKLVGPADQDLLVAVDASATILSVKVRYDTTHGTTNKPQALLLANGEIGVAAQTLTASVGVDTWENLLFASFTPTAKGFVTLRLVSRAAAGGGIAYFDTLAGAASSALGLDHFRKGEPIPAVAGGGGAGGISRSRIIGGV